MLLDLPFHRLEYIDSLREKYSTMIFSNANDIHMTEAEKFLCEIVALLLLCIILTESITAPMRL